MSNEQQPGGAAVLSSDGLGAAVKRACPFRIPAHTEAGCCRWDVFLDGFACAWARRGDLPTDDQWGEARGDWRAGNTGWEAAQNAFAREKERKAQASTKPLVWLGGRNYAEAGTPLAIKYGRKKEGA
jgi:hypothetical protein